MYLAVVCLLSVPAVLPSHNIKSYSRAKYSDFQGDYAQSCVSGGILVFLEVVFVLAARLKEFFLRLSS
jgi:hypothetical protein